MINKYIKDILLVSVFAMFCNNSFGYTPIIISHEPDECPCAAPYDNTYSKNCCFGIETGGDNYNLTMNNEENIGSDTNSFATFSCGNYGHFTTCPTGKSCNKITFGTLTCYEIKEDNDTEEYNCTLKENPTSHDIGCCALSYACSDYTEDGVTLQSSPCSSGYTQTAYTKPIGSGNGTCYKCVYEDKCNIHFTGTFNSFTGGYPCTKNGTLCSGSVESSFIDTCKDGLSAASAEFKDDNEVNEDFFYYDSLGIVTESAGSTTPAGPLCHKYVGVIYNRLSKGSCSENYYERLCTGQPKETCPSGQTFISNGCTSDNITFFSGLKAKGAEYGYCGSGSGGATEGTAHVMISGCHSINSTCTGVLIYGRSANTVVDSNYDKRLTSESPTGYIYTLKKAKEGLPWCFNKMQISHTEPGGGYDNAIDKAQESIEILLKNDNTVDIICSY